MKEKRNGDNLLHTEKKLLEISAKDLIKKIFTNKELSHVKQSAFDWYDDTTKEIVQVQVVVTRYQPDFLEIFDIEEMRTAKPRSI